MCAHDHDVRVLSVSLECREEIRKMHQIKKTITPANIILNLEGINDQRLKTLELPQLVIPKIDALYNYLSLYFRKQNGHTNMNLGELHKWCFEHETVPPESSPDEPFVVKYKMFFSDEKYKCFRRLWLQLTSIQC